MTLKLSGKVWTLVRPMSQPLSSFDGCSIVTVAQPAVSQSVLLLLCSLAVRCVVWFVVGDTDLISQPYGLIFCLINSPQHNEVKAHLDGKGQIQTASLPHTRSVFGSFSLNDSKRQVEEPTAPPVGRSIHCRRHTYSHSLDNLSPDPCVGLSTT